MDNRENIFKRLWKGWVRIAAKIAHVQGHIILSVIFIVVVSPIAILFKIFSKNPFQSDLSADKKSYWVDRPPIDSVETFLKKEF